MASLDGRAVIVTGAGRGLGREHALMLGAEGAAVVVNDVGCEPDGTGSDPSLAASTAEEIVAAGGRAVASAADVRSVDGAHELLDAAVSAFGDVHGLVNNAGVLRDRMFVNMSEEEWDDVIRGQLRATFAPTRVLAGYWRDRAKGGEELDAAVVNVSSTSGLKGQAGQSNYGAAKAGIAALTIILADEIARYGIRVNAVVPVARTRMTENLPAFAEMLAAPSDPAEFDVYHPGNVSPIVAWLVQAGNSVTGQVFYAKGGEIRRLIGWQDGATIKKESRWTVAELDDAMPAIVGS
jgi:NAD(P)-dependent dehydrogenase (short-subunit alcohol dehydrogenase family)